MKRLLLLSLAALVAAFLVPAATAQYCHETSGGCFDMGGLGLACDGTVNALPCPTASPTPTPTPRQGDITWRPQGANYVQGPSAVRNSDGAVYVVAHAGFCCDVPWPWGPGWEQAFILRYGQEDVTINSPSLPWPEDRHELGFQTVVGFGDGWLVSGVRTTWTSWVINKDTNRTMLWFAYYPSLGGQPDIVWWDVGQAWDYDCRLRNTCPGLGPMMPSLVWSSGTLYLIASDNTGYLAGTSGVVAYTVKVELGERRIGLTKQFVSSWSWAHPDIPISDVALANDGTVRALVSRRWESPECWWGFCDEISEWISSDGGQSWEQGTRSWRDSQGRLAWDAGYVKDRLGGIDSDATVVVSLVSTNPDPTSGEWKLHWWANPGAVLPRTWGLEPGAMIPRVRKYLERGK